MSIGGGGAGGATGGFELHADSAAAAVPAIIVNESFPFCIAELPSPELKMNTARNDLGPAGSLAEIWQFLDGGGSDEVDHGFDGRGSDACGWRSGSRRASDAADGRRAAAGDRLSVLWRRGRCL
jgi:hypothetical protein